MEDLYASTTGNRFAGTNADTAGARFERELPVAPVEVNLYSAGTPNGHKVGILLEELGCEYAAHGVDIRAGEQFSSGFVRVNPNSKIPCILHRPVAAAASVASGPFHEGRATATTTAAGKDAGIRVFESGAILVYLADYFGKLIPPPSDAAKRAECLSWVFWQMSGQGPMTGNMGHFLVYAPRDKPEALDYGVARYGMEVRRLLSVLDNHLADGRTWMLGDEYSIADIACYPWIETVEVGYGAGKLIGTTSGRFPHLDKWVARMRARPGVQRGMCVLTGKKRAEELVRLNRAASPQQQAL